MSTWLSYAWLTIRPKTLTMAIVPVVVATALAWTETGQIQGGLILAIVLGALCVQIGTNLYNDAADFERGTDTATRIGPARAAAQGWFTVDQLKKAALFCLISLLLPTTYLIWVGGWPLLFVGLFSVLAGYSYTGGPRPIACSPLGELTVFIFFGIVLTVSSYYLQTLRLSSDVFWLGAALGLFAAAVLLVNNYRDLEGDQQSGRLTLVSYLGRQHCRWVYLGLLLLPFLLPLLLPAATTIVLLSLPMALYLIRRIFIEAVGPNLNSLLASTAKLQLLYGILISVGLIISV